MQSPATEVTEKAKMARKEFLNSFVTALTSFSSSAADQLFTHIPEFLVKNFDAGRAELWLWDEQLVTGYLVHSAGAEGSRKHDYVAQGRGAVGKTAQTRERIENVPLASLGGADADFAQTTGLSHVSVYPLCSGDRLVALLGIYTAFSVSDEILTWWRTYAEICSIKVPDVLAAREHEKQITQLSLLFEATRLLNSTLDLAELLELILKIAREEVSADRGSMFLVDSQRRELWSIVATGLDHQEIRVPFGKGIAGRVAETGEAVNVADAYKHPDFDASFDQKFGYHTSSVFAMPIRHRNGEIVGVIQLLNKKNGPAFNAQDEEFLGKLSGHMAMALENARQHRESIEKQRLQKELALARQIQKSLLPEAPPVVPGFDLAVRSEPCFEVGGDYYDFLTLGPQSLLLVVADVEGKGMSSALVISNLQATLRALVMHLHSLEVLTFSLNEMLCNDIKNRRHLSVFLGLVDTRRNGLHYINAGHVPPILINGATGKHRLLHEGGTLVGLFPRSEYVRGQVKLGPGDVLVCCTDGILAASPAKEGYEEFGVERLAEVVADHRHRPASEIVEAVFSEINRFSVGNQDDDRVLLVMKVNSNGGVTQVIGRR